MADIQNFTMVRNGSVNFNIPQFDVTASFTSVRDSQQVLDTFDGVFPSVAVVSRFTAEEIEEAFREMYMKLILKKAAEL
jgi:hypothetical protein